MKKIQANSLRIIVLFTQKVVIKLSKSMNPGSGKNLFRIAGKKGAGSRILNTSLVFRDINEDAT
jgi:hypothetical protein